MPKEKMQKKRTRGVLIRSFFRLSICRPLDPDHGIFLRVISDLDTSFLLAPCRLQTSFSIFPCHSTDIQLTIMLSRKLATTISQRALRVSSFRSITSTSFILPDPSFSSTNKEHASNFPLSKIVATIGPTSEQAGPLKKVVEAGMHIMRLNFSHATIEEVELRCTNLAAAQVRYKENAVMCCSRKLWRVLIPHLT
jgi:hypothetical protein